MIKKLLEGTRAREVILENKLRSDLLGRLWTPERIRGLMRQNGIETNKSDEELIELVNEIYTKHTELFSGDGSEVDKRKVFRDYFIKKVRGV